MFHKIRNFKRELPREEVTELLKKGEYGILSTVGADGFPYGVPVNYVYSDNRIGFHCAMDTGHKLENIKYNDKVCFTVVGNTEVLPSKFSTKYESAVVFGTAHEAEDKKEILELLIHKYSPQFKKEGMEYISRSADNTGVYVIEIEHVTGKGRR